MYRPYCLNVTALAIVALAVLVAYLWVDDTPLQWVVGFWHNRYVVATATFLTFAGAGIFLYNQWQRNRSA
jgi:hypothetical protein